MSKCSKISEAWTNGDRIGALRIAARFFDRSVDTQIFKRGMDAHNHPDFYRQLRQANRAAQSVPPNVIIQWTTFESGNCVFAATSPCARAGRHAAKNMMQQVRTRAIFHTPARRVQALSLYRLRRIPRAHQIRKPFDRKVAEMMRCRNHCVLL